VAVVEVELEADVGGSEGLNGREGGLRRDV